MIVIRDGRHVQRRGDSVMCERDFACFLENIFERDAFSDIYHCLKVADQEECAPIDHSTVSEGFMYIGDGNGTLSNDLG